MTDGEVEGTGYGSDILSSHRERDGRWVTPGSLSVVRSPCACFYVDVVAQGCSLSFKCLSLRFLG